MIGTTLVREPPAATRPSLSRAVAPPVLIEVPTLPGTRAHRARAASRGRTVEARPRRRLRRGVRLILVGTAAVVGAGAVASVIALRSTVQSSEASTEPDGSITAEPFAIELEHPIPVPAEAIEQEPHIEDLPVAFPGYLLPGDGDEERGDARP